MRSAVEQRRGARASQRAGSDRLELAMAAGRMGCWELDLAGTWNVVISPELETLLGLDAAEPNRSIASLLNRIYPADRAQVMRAFVGAIRNKTDLELEFRIVRPGRPPGWLLCRGRVYSGALGSAERVVGVGIDITARKQAHLKSLRSIEELEKQVAEGATQLQAISQELETLCYSISHDLRAPLRSIRGFNEVLLERYAGKLDDRGEEFLRRACASGQLLDDLINDLLKLSRVGRSPFSPQPVNLSELAKAASSELRRSDPSRSVSFRIGPSPVVTGDESLLRIMLQQLLLNAWKFTSKRARAGIEFGFIPKPSGTFFVRDNGAGFDSASAGRLFGVFQRLHAASDYPGNGIGLALAQRIINRHGGRIWAEGTLDRGATFYFSLPIHETR